jgi:hypothetical protein
LSCAVALSSSAIARSTPFASVVFARRHSSATAPALFFAACASATLLSLLGSSGAARHRRQRRRRGGARARAGGAAKDRAALDAAGRQLAQKLPLLVTAANAATAAAPEDETRNGIVAETRGALDETRNLLHGAKRGHAIDAQPVSDALAAVAAKCDVLTPDERTIAAALRAFDESARGVRRRAVAGERRRRVRPGDAAAVEQHQGAAAGDVAPAGGRQVGPGRHAGGV